MILKGSQRAGARQLALHLLNAEDNEHVEVHELRGFSGNDLASALKEAQAVAKGTQAKQFLFSLSLNPPRDEKVPIQDFEAAIEKIERKLGLEDQPRAVIFHEKDGRRHAHVVWSRIDTDEMKAINLPHFKLKLRDISRELYLEHGWELPKGLRNKEDRDPANYDHDQYQQAKRAGHDPKALKALFQKCWSASDSRDAFSNALSEQGFILAKGDRRGFVAVDHHGEVYAVAKLIGVRTAELKRKLGDAKKLPTLAEAKDLAASHFSDIAQQQENDIAARHQALIAPLLQKRQELVDRQRAERRSFEEVQSLRWQKESKERSGRLTKGIRGLWDRLTGKHTAITRRNEIEALQAFQRDRAEKDDLVFKQQEQRKLLHRQIQQTRRSLVQERTDFRRAIARGEMQLPNRPLNRSRAIDGPERKAGSSVGAARWHELER